MNEIKHIHLGNQAFTIALDAHSALRKYIDAIAKHTDEEVEREIEMRMAELLTERGIDDKKVVLLADVEFLQENLGQPTDFADDDERAAPASAADKKLFRDPQDAWIGGVASGLAAYLGVSPLFARVLFVILTLAWGGGVFVYLVLWLLVPEARTQSDRLKMQGKPVTVDTIVEFVNDESVKENAKRMGSKAANAASRANSVAMGAAERILMRFTKIMLVIGGVWTILVGLVGALVVAATGTFILTSSEQLSAAGKVFPVGASEHMLMGALMTAGILSCILIVAAGIGLVKRKWPMPGWLTAGLIVLVIAGGAIASPLAVSSVSRVEKRYEAARRTTAFPVEQFSKVEVSGKYAHVVYEPANEYSIEITAVGDIKNQNLKTEVVNGVLLLDAHESFVKQSCDRLCVFKEDPVITIKAPSVDEVAVTDNAYFATKKALLQSGIAMKTNNGGRIDLRYIFPEQVSVMTENNRITSVALINLQTAIESDALYYNSNDAAYVSMHRTKSLILAGDATCYPWEPMVQAFSKPDQVIINNKPVNVSDLKSIDDDDENQTEVNCVRVN